MGCCHSPSQETPSTPASALPAKPGLRHWAAIAALVIVGVSAAVIILTEDSQAWLPGSAALLGFIALEWRRLVGSARLMVSVVLVLAIALPALGLITMADLHSALDRGLYLGFFVLSLGLLQDVAGSSPFILRCSAMLLNQPPGRRYSVLTGGGALLGVLLSLGAVGLLGSLIARGVENARAVSGDKVAMIRMERMTLASLRGVVSVPLWSPTSIAMPLVMAGLPTLTWLGILPFGAVLAACLLLLGWSVDRLSFPRPARPASVKKTRDPGVLLKLVGLVAMLPILGGLLGTWLEISMISAILLLAPALAILWHGLQQRSERRDWLLPAGARQFTRTSLPRLSDMRSEITIFAASGALGMMLVPLIDGESLGAAIESLGFGSGWLLFFGYLFIVLTSILGLNPIVSVTLFVGTAAQLPGHGLQTLDIALTALYSWSIAAGISPLSASVRLAARPIGQPPTVVGFRWNGRYTIAATVLAWLLAMALSALRYA
ncbi:hypothetical protein ACMA5I_04535 [Paracoccaceae bacterium GXU_MW_L88]